jgi:Flp pilus assembly protein TadD
MFKNKWYALCNASVPVTILILVIGFSGSSLKISFAQSAGKDAGGKAQVIMLYLRHGENDLAIKSAEEWLIANPEDIAVINVLAEAYINKGDLANAETTLQKAEKVRPDNVSSRKLLARVYKMNAEKFPAAKEKNLNLALGQLKTCDPSDGDVLFEMAQIYAGLNDKSMANQTLDRALTLSPNDTRLANFKKKINAGN